MTLTPRSQHVNSPHVPSKTLKGSHGCCDDASAMVKPAKEMDSPRPAVCGMPVEWPSGESWLHGVSFVEQKAPRSVSWRRCHWLRHGVPGSFPASCGIDQER